MFRSSKVPVSHEDLFVERYDALVRIALQLTQRDHEAAVDLVQDAFVRFIVIRPDLSGIRNLDGYFYATLRNLHLSRTRRSGHTWPTMLSIADWDSADIGLRALDEHARLRARDELWAACRYACVRKDSSKSGSVFLLRFFHGYVPSEIARVLRTTPRIVDEWLRLARREVKVYLNDPQQLGFVFHNRNPREPQRPPEIATGVEPAEFLRALQQHIFRHRHTTCLSARELSTWYDAGVTEPIETEILAQIVCCPECLERVGHMLGMSEPSDRFPTDTLGPTPRGGRSEIRAASRRTRQVFEHRPQELRVAVNGFIVGVQRVAGEMNDLTVTVGQPEPIGLIELFSEQAQCLAALDIDPPPAGPVEQTIQSELSDGRFVELAVSFAGPWPSVRAVYRDPWLANEAGSLEAHGAPSLEREATAPSGQRGLVRRLHALLPRTWKARVALVTVAVWLLFFTPGLKVSAAQQIVHFVRGAAAGVMRLFEPARELPQQPGPKTPVPTVAPLAPSVMATSPPRSALIRPPRPTLTTATAMALELNVLARLQRVDAYLGQEVRLGRGSNSVQLHGVVTDTARRQTFVAALGSLQRDPSLIVDVRTLEDAVTQRAQVAPPITIEREFEFEKDRIPVYDILRAYYARSTSQTGAATDDRSVDDAVRRFASRIVDRSRLASQHAWSLLHLTERYPWRGVVALGLDAQQAWSSLLRGHVTAFQREITALQRELLPVFSPAAPPAGDWSPTEEPASVIAEPTQLVEDLINLDRARDSAVRAAFAVSSAGHGVSAIQADEFWRLLRDSQRAARQLEQAAGIKQ